MVITIVLLVSKYTFQSITIEKETVSTEKPVCGFQQDTKLPINKEISCSPIGPRYHEMAGIQKDTLGIRAFSNFCTFNTHILCLMKALSWCRLCIRVNSPR